MPEIHVSLFTPTALVHLYRDAGLEPRYVSYDGVVRFKVLKTLRGGWQKRLARPALRCTPLVRFIDRHYGVSDMPWAVKPAST